MQRLQRPDLLGIYFLALPNIDHFNLYSMLCLHGSLTYLARDVDFLLVSSSLILKDVIWLRKLSLN